jgi:hypothetical protein
MIVSSQTPMREQSIISQNLRKPLPPELIDFLNRLIHNT